MSPLGPGIRLVRNLTRRAENMGVSQQSGTVSPLILEVGICSKLNQKFSHPVMTQKCCFHQWCGINLSTIPRWRRSLTTLSCLFSVLRCRQVSSSQFLFFMSAPTMIMIRQAGDKPLLPLPRSRSFSSLYLAFRSLTKSSLSSSSASYRAVLSLLSLIISSAFLASSSPTMSE